MKKKFLIIFSLLIGALVVVSTVQAFTIGNIDGYWDVIDGGGSSPGGATGQTWATGPSATSTDYDNPGVGNTTTSEGQRINTQSKTEYDWNQVRYGNTSPFGSKSGFGFLGRTNVGSSPEKDVPFLLGQFCHFNNPIPAATNPLGSVPLLVYVTDIACDEPFEIVDDTTMQFSYIFNLDETTNTPSGCNKDDYGTSPCLCKSGSSYYNACPYGPKSNAYGAGSPNWPSDGGSYCIKGQTAYDGPEPESGGLNYEGCADRVNITKDPDLTKVFFICRDETTVPGEPVDKEYTVSLLGFIKKPSTGCLPTLSEEPSEFSNNLVYTAEKQNNCYCVYGAITTENLTPVILLDFGALETEGGNLLTWQTATEVNHLGFNVLRSTTEFSVKEKTNSKLVTGDSNPGNPFGGHYFFLDETAEPGVLYHYWIEDVPSDTSYTPGLYGPVTAVRP